MPSAIHLEAHAYQKGQHSVDMLLDRVRRATIFKSRLALPQPGITMTTAIDIVRGDIGPNLLYRTR